MQPILIRRTGRIALRSVLALAASLAIDRVEARRRSPTSGSAVGRLAGPVAKFDQGLAHDAERITRRIARLAARLEGDLDAFCLLEARLRRAVCRVEVATDHSVSDEEFADLAEQLGIHRVRPALEQLTSAHPDLGRRTTARLDRSRGEFPAA
jgi:hypothetical protein